MPEPENALPPELMSILQNEDTLRMLRQTAEGMGLGGQLDHALQNLSPSETPPPEPEKQESGTGSGFSPEMLKSFSLLMQAMRTSGKGSPEYSFLKSLKPLLRPEKGARVDQALQIIQLIGVMNALGKNGSLSGLLNGLPGLSELKNP